MKKQSRSALALLVALALIVTGLGFPGMNSIEAFASSTKKISVRIEGNGRGTDGTHGGKQTILKETTVEVGANCKGIDAVNAALTGAGLLAAQGSGGFYTTFGGIAAEKNAGYRIMLNDENSIAGLDAMSIKEGDRIVLDISPYAQNSPWNNTLDYGYFRAECLSTSLESYSGQKYAAAEIRLNLHRIVDNGWGAATQYEDFPGGNQEIYVNGAPAYTPGGEIAKTDRENGIAVIKIMDWGGGYGVFNFDITTSGGGVSKAYCNVKLTYTGDKEQVVAMVSQPAAKDTSLGRLELNFGEALSTGTNLLPYLGQTGIQLDNGVENVWISAVPGAGKQATVKVNYQAAGESVGDEILYDTTGTSLKYKLNVGENVAKFTVTNGSERQIHTLKLFRKAAGTDNSSTEVSDLIAGIRNESESHPDYYYTDDWALGMAAAGQTMTAKEKETYLKNVLERVKAPTTATNVGSVAKCGIALTAWNIDARQLPDKNHPTGAGIDLIHRVSQVTGKLDSAYAATYVLELYDLGNYEIPQDAVLTRHGLLTEILQAQDADGSWYGSYGADGTGMVLSALAPYNQAKTTTNGIGVASCQAITASIDRALTYLSTKQGIDGSFPGFGGVANSNTQTTVLTGLHALGINSHTDSRFVRKGTSALEHLLSYKTAGNKLGYTDNLTANELACQQGLGTLATYENLDNERNENLYHFKKEVAIYTQWPNSPLLTGISAVTSKTEYKVGDSVDPGSITVSAIFDGKAESATKVAIESCMISPAALMQAGNKTVKVSYQGHTASFVVHVSESGGGGSPSQQKISLTIKDGAGNVIAAKNNLLIENGVTTALDALRTVANQAGVSIVISAGTYVESISGIGEFDQGANSGWLYKVNGVTPPVIPANEYELTNGDVVVWYFTKDYTSDSSSSKWNKEEKPTGAGITGAALKKFTDVKTGDWYYEAVASMLEKGIMAGKTETSFGAQSNITRAEFVQVLANMAGVDLTEYLKSEFDDVDKNAWYCAPVAWAKEMGITSGFQMKFRPDDFISREDLAVMLNHYMDKVEKKQGKEEKEANRFADASDISGYARASVEKMQKNGIFSGKKNVDESYRFDPMEFASRAEVAAMLANYLK